MTIDFFIIIIIKHNTGTNKYNLYSILNYCIIEKFRLNVRSICFIHFKIYMKIKYRTALIKDYEKIVRGKLHRYIGEVRTWLFIIFFHSPMVEPLQCPFSIA